MIASPPRTHLRSSKRGKLSPRDVTYRTLYNEPLKMIQVQLHQLHPTMAFKVALLAALLAVAHAGGPAAYSTFTSPVDYGSVGSTHESTVKGFGGNSVISQYSKAVDTPYSSVRKYDTRISNDALAYAPAAHAIAAPVAYGAAAPAYYGAGYGAYGAPALAYGAGYRAYGAGYRAYGAAPALAYGAGYRAYGAAPALAYGAGYRAYGGYAAPALAAAPVAAAYHGVPAYAAAYHGAAYAPAVAKAAIAAPLGYSAAPAVAHLSFSGLGAAYGW
ncbi:hypothetical protein L9F63_012870 [Diploptera punctata]|uniref:Uncharacterized protein n=1 Tax=Diploptera punctata TaxID=6984 RepID=A0AAD8ENE8_DIPPU|nr:hypothetical protein L9F63_012870 [Diploptera punctata]